MSPTDDTSARPRVESATRKVAASPQVIFDLLANPAAHSTFDGSGTIRSSRVIAPDRLELGSRFGMRMKSYGVPYRITSTVIEFDEPNQIAWRHLGRHVWRYRLREVDGGTEVTEEFDWGAGISPRLLDAVDYPERNKAAIEATLDRLVAMFDEQLDAGEDAGSEDPA